MKFKRIAEQETMVTIESLEDGDLFSLEGGTDIYMKTLNTKWDGDEIGSVSLSDGLLMHTSCLPMSERVVRVGAILVEGTAFGKKEN